MYPPAAGCDRTDDDVERFLGALDDASFSDDKIEVAEMEAKEYGHLPPFNADQLCQVRLSCLRSSVHFEESSLLIPPLSGAREIRARG